MADAMRNRDPGANEEMLVRERAKPMRAPTIVVAAARVQKGHRIPEFEQIAAAAAAGAEHHAGGARSWVWRDVEDRRARL